VVVNHRSDRGLEDVFPRGKDWGGLMKKRKSRGIPRKGEEEMWVSGQQKGLQKCREAGSQQQVQWDARTKERGGGGT